MLCAFPIPAKPLPFVSIPPPRCESGACCFPAPKLLLEATPQPLALLVQFILFFPKFGNSSGENP